MNTNHHANPQRRMPGVAVLVVVGLLLTACTPSNRLSKVVRHDASAPLGYVEVSDRDADIVSVIRAGKRLDTRTPLTLQPGDEIRTGPQAGAVIRLINGGEAVVAPNSHVRLGSLEVFFGKVFADLRGAFSVEDDTIVAAVEGTRFMFERQRGGRTRVAVLEGRVRCISKGGNWEPFPLDAGQGMWTRYGAAAHPRIERLQRREIAEIERWADGIRDAARSGYCCASGKVSKTLSNQCRGKFEETERAARRQCQSGWCCRDGQVSSSIYAECRGRFNTRKASAERACAPPPPASPTGWCCVRGRIAQTDKQACDARKGAFYSSASTAKARCERIVY